MIIDNAKTELLVVQATTFCNIDCSYCYLPNRSKSYRFDLSILSDTFRNLYESDLLGKEIIVLWHCGEPLVLPIDFYKKASEILKECATLYNVEIHQSFQTNGMLISQEFCDLVKSYKISVGVSIDGPQFIHDRFRKKRNGSGSFQDTYSGIMKLKQNNIPFSALAVVTDFTLDHCKAFYEFFEELSPTRLGINLEEQSGVNLKSSLVPGNGKERFESFFKELWELSYGQKERVRIREFEDLIYRLNLTTDAYFLNTLTIPFQHITIDHLGNYSTFCPELMASSSQEFILGNINQGLISNIKSTKKFDEMNSAISKGVQNCKESCEYFELCFGGVPSNKHYETGSFESTETVDCLFSKKYLADIVIQALEQEQNLENFVVR